MNKYAELMKKHHDENNTLPLKAAFGDAQFKQMMKEWGLTTSEEDLKKIRSYGGIGLYYLAKDEQLIRDMCKRHTEELKELMSTEEGQKDAFMYEFANHECGYTYTPQDAIAALGFTVKEIENDKRLNKIFKEAWNEYLDKCE